MKEPAWQEPGLVLHEKCMAIITIMEAGQSEPILQVMAAGLFARMLRTTGALLRILSEKALKDCPESPDVERLVTLGKSIVSHAKASEMLVSEAADILMALEGRASGGEE